VTLFPWCWIFRIISSEMTQSDNLSAIVVVRAISSLVGVGRGGDGGC
jgi:hypothetical protein